MVFAGVLAILLAPVTTQVVMPDLKIIVPDKFDGWKLDSSDNSLIVNPDLKGDIGKIYNQVLTRIYISKQGERVMLSIAYGRDQSMDLNIHRPEICYVTSGFDISKMTKTFVDTTIGKIPVMRLVASKGTRNEPVTYWIRVGNSLTRGWVEQKLVSFGYGLTGKIPDGLLFRISNISNDAQDSYRIQNKFMVALFNAVRSEDRYWLVGQLHK